MIRLTCFLGAALVVAADIDELVKQLKSPDADMRRAAAKALAESGADAKPAVAALADALKDKDTYVRRFAAQALGEVGPDARSAVPALAGALKDDKKQVGEAAAEALGKLGGPGAVTPLMDAFKDKSRDIAVRRKAVEAVGKLGDDAKPAVQVLADSLKEPGMGKGKAKGKAMEADRELRNEVVMALANLGPAAKDALPVLKGLDQRQRDRTFRKLVVEAIKKIEAE